MTSTLDQIANPPAIPPRSPQCRQCRAILGLADSARPMPDAASTAAGEPLPPEPNEP
jgi:hypothetical protein